MHKTILIAGASGNIGSYLMNFLSNKGFIVYGIGRKQLRFENSNCHYTSLDIENEEKVQSYFSQFRKNKIAIDYYIHCIGKNISVPVGLLSKGRIEEMFSSEIASSMMFIKEVLALMMVNKDGLLLNFSSIVVSSANQGSSLYGMGKVAMEQFFKVISKEYERFGIKTCSIRVPIIEDTEMAKRLLPNVREELQNQNNLNKPVFLNDLALSIHQLVNGNRLFTSGEVIEL